jgi:hypothetical protein
VDDLFPAKHAVARVEEVVTCSHTGDLLMPPATGVVPWRHVVVGGAEPKRAEEDLGDLGSGQVVVRAHFGVGRRVATVDYSQVGQEVGVVRRGPTLQIVIVPEAVNLRGARIGNRHIGLTSCHHHLESLDTAQVPVRARPGGCGAVAPMDRSQLGEPS